MDTRRQHGQYWPGTRTGGGETPTPADNGKVDRVDLGTLPADATGAEMRTAIRNIQNAIRPLATAIAAALCGFVMAQTAPWDSLRGGVHVVTNEQDTAAMARIVSATNALGSEMSAMSERVSVKVALATNGIPARIAAATNGLPEKIVAATNALHTSLAPTISAASTALQPAATNEIPAQIAAATNGLPEKIAAATNGIPAKIAAVTNGLPEKIAAATNDVPVQIAAATNDIPARIAASTNGLPEKIASATNALHRGLAPTIAAASTALQPAATNAVAQAMAKQAANLSDRIEQMSLAFAASNTATRLATHDGSIYQDATGVVWRAENFEVPGMFSLKKIEYYTNGVYQAETNAPAGISWAMWEGYDNATWEILAGESGMAEDAEERYANWLEFTNHVAAADMEDINKFYYVAQLDVAGEEIELTATEEIYAGYVTIEWPMTETNRTRYLVFERTNVTATIRTPIDRVLYASSGGGEGITTNDVCNIVTNEVDEWTYEGLPEGAEITLPPRYIEEQAYPWEIAFDVGSTNYVGVNITYDAELNPVMFNCFDLGESRNFTVTATRQTRNALGLARLIDLPPITNGIPEAIAEKASTNDVQLSPVYGGNGERFAGWVFRGFGGYDLGNSVYEVVKTGVEANTGNDEFRIKKDGNFIFDPAYDNTGGDESVFWFEEGMGEGIRAERIPNPIIGYTLGAQTNKLLATTSITNGLATAALLASLSSQMSQASQDATNYTDAVSENLYNDLENGQKAVALAYNANGLEDNGSGDSLSAGDIFMRIDAAMTTTNGLPEAISIAASSSTNYTDYAIAATDTSYPRVIGITNINQTVQYVAIDSAVPTTLSIMLPTSGDTKDWIVYVTSQTNVTINLPAATWWLADTSATNDIAPRTPTALYFSQAAETIYTVGRQEFKKVEIQ